MKRILSIITILLFLTSPKLFSQIDKNGNPVFNSIKIEEIKVDSVEIISNYYTIKNNIDNKLSSVFISNNPTSKDYINFSTKLPSYYFLVHNKGVVLGMAMLIPKIENSSFFYNVVIPGKNSNYQIESQLKGNITEDRAKEILNIVKDNANIKQNILKFDNGNLEILEYNKILKEFKNIILEKIVSNENSADETLDKYIEAESQEGGKLDFKDTVEKYDGAFIAFDQIMYNKKDFAILMWGASVKKTGLKNFVKAQNLWMKINKRKLTEPEIKAMKIGFETDFK